MSLGILDPCSLYVDPDRTAPSVDCCLLSHVHGLSSHVNAATYEGCSNMDASSFITFFTYMLRQNVIPFWKELFVAFKMAPNRKIQSLHFLGYGCIHKGHSCILKFFLIAIHVLVHVRIECHIFVSLKQNGTKF